MGKVPVSLLDVRCGSLGELKRLNMFVCGSLVHTLTYNPTPCLYFNLDRLKYLYPGDSPLRRELQHRVPQFFSRQTNRLTLYLVSYWVTLIQPQRPRGNQITSQSLSIRIQSTSQSLSFRIPVTLRPHLNREFSMSGCDPSKSSV